MLELFMSDGDVDRRGGGCTSRGTVGRVLHLHGSQHATCDVQHAQTNCVPDVQQAHQMSSVHTQYTSDNTLQL